MIDTNFFTWKTFKQLPQVKQTTINLVACLIMHTSKKTTRYALNLSKQQAVNDYPKAIQQRGTVKVLWTLSVNVVLC